MIRKFDFNEEAVQMLKNVDDIPIEIVYLDSVRRRFFAITPTQKAEIEKIYDTINALSQTEINEMTGDERWEYGNLLNQATRVLKFSVELKETPDAEQEHFTDDEQGMSLQ